MKFNIIALNPPYNKGMDIDFIQTAYKLSTDYVVVITPAKWQTAESNQRILSSMSYGEFREKIVPYISYVCFYPDCKDLFKIMQTDGITVYKIDKNKKKQDTCKVENRCESIPWYNSVENRSITERQPLLNIGNEIVEYIKNKKTDFKFNLCNNNGRYRVYTTNQMSGGGLYAITKNNPAVHYLGVSIICDTSKPNWHSELNTVHKEVFRSDSEEECKSFISWIQSKFTRFFLAINVNRMTGVVDNDTFRFVPAPPSGKFDHIYTNKELYKAFNLPQKYIDVIDSVIKERRYTNFNKGEYQ